MDDEQTVTPDEQTEPQEPVTDEQTTEVAEEVVETPTETPVEEAPTEEAVEEEEEYPSYEVPQVPQLDFNNLQMGEDGLIDPNVLAGAINQQVNSAAESARIAARNEYQEQRQEERSWDKAYEKYPELKSNKELRDLVHRARLGEVTDMLSKTRDPQSVKLPTPSQIASKFFKYADGKKVEGMKQATENTVVQESAHLETSGTRTNDSSDARTKMFQNLKNPNKEVAKQAGQDYLKAILFGDK